MERRREARIRADKPVELTVLGNQEASGPAQVTEFSGHGLQVVLHRPIPVNSAIKIEGEDWLMLGEVCYCRQEGIHFVAGLKIDQTLENLDELSKLNENLLSTQSRTERTEAKPEDSTVLIRR